MEIRTLLRRYPIHGLKSGVAYDAFVPARPDAYLVHKIDGHEPLEKFQLVHRGPTSDAALRAAFVQAFPETGRVAFPACEALWIPGLFPDRAAELECHTEQWVSVELPD